MANDLGWAVIWGVVYAAVNAWLHYHGPQVAQPEFYARPIYYGVGFTGYALAGLAWALCTDHLLWWLAGVVLIGGGGGMGMLATYAWHAAQREHGDTAAVDRVAGED